MVAQPSNISVQVLEQNIANKLNNNVEDIELVNLLNNYSESLRLYDQDFVKSLEYCEIAKKISENLKYAKGLAQSLLNIGTCFVYMNDETKPEKILKQSLAIFRKLKDSQGEALNLIILGAAKLVNKNYVEAYDFVETGLNLSILTGYHKGQIVAFYKLAQINKKLQNFDSTIKFCKKALDISDEYDIRVRIHSLIGSTLLLQSEIVEAKNFFNKALVDLKNYKDRLSFAQINIQLGKIALIDSDFEAAKEHFRIGASTTKEIGLLEHSANTFIDISDAYLEKKDYDSALEILKKFQRQTENKKMFDRSASVFMKMAMIKLKNDKPYEALNLLNQVWKLVKDGNDLKLQYQCQKSFSKAFQVTEKFDEALTHHKLFYKYKRRYEQQKAKEEIEILTHRIKLEKQRDLKQLATLKNIELAQTIYEVHEKSNALTEAEKAITSLQTENELLHISNPGCLHCSAMHKAA